MNDLNIVKNARKFSNLLFSDYVKLIFENFQELSGDRLSSDDKSIIGGLAKLDAISVLIIGQEKGRTIHDKHFHNYGMPYPEGYRKVLKLLKLAEKFKLPVITFIDTPGAYPGVDAEKRGQAIAIAQNLQIMALLKTVIISIIIGEGCSGGALAMSVCDKLYMLDTAYFSPITPEGCVSILSKTRDLTRLTEKMCITPKKLLKLKLIDDVIKSNFASINHFVLNIKRIIKNDIDCLEKYELSILLKKRKSKIISFGKKI